MSYKLLDESTVESAIKTYLKELIDKGFYTPTETEENTFDGCSKHNHCKYCGKEIMQDSQGNWF